ncbi:MAG: hypothetical protein AAGA17_00350 [Actinomycetota bacterium]
MKPDSMFMAVTIGLLLLAAVLVTSYQEQLGLFAALAAGAFFIGAHLGGGLITRLAGGTVGMGAIFYGLNAAGMVTLP